MKISKKTLEEIQKEMQYMEMEDFLSKLKGRSKYKESYAYLRGRHIERIKCLSQGHIKGKD